MSLFDEMEKSSFEKHPNVAFPKLNTGVTGVIVGEPRKVLMPNLNDPAKTDTKYVFDLETLAPTWTGPQDEVVELPAGEVVTLWVKGQMATAITAAVKKAGLRDIREGATLTVKWTDKKPIEGRPKPQKIYSAEYAAPVPRMAVADLDDAGDDE